MSFLQSQTVHLTQWLTTSVDRGIKACPTKKFFSHHANSVFSSSSSLESFLLPSPRAFFILQSTNRGRRVGDTVRAKGVVVVLVLAAEAQGRKGSSSGSRVVPPQPQNATFCFSQDPLRVPGVAALASLFVWQRNTISSFLVLGGVLVQPPKLRPVVFCLTKFGGVDDGVTLNTEVFEKGVRVISKLGNKGGGKLTMPPGRWLTAPFNLTSHMTLFLAPNVVILAIQIFLDSLDNKESGKDQILKPMNVNNVLVQRMTFTEDTQSEGS
ncbi:hypothetical protein V8G54_008088 [Vigna mungo]|uniref:Uncharacterized protein n=1 Tax=Vigna mungo TaxID=3915 RepID=A0AAQ3P4K6_VIGMU